MNIRYSILITCFLYAAFGTIDSRAIAGEGVEWGRLRLLPAITVSESYSDNLYLVNKNETEDYFITMTPELSLDLAVVPKNYFSLNYRGDFLSYADADNFRQDHHYGSLSFNSETAKGSRFVAGVSSQVTAIQPFSEQEQSKDYTLQSAYMNLLARLGRVTDIEAQYSRQEREFDEQDFFDDNYIRDTCDFEVVYTRSSIWPLLVQYRYVRQDNNDLDEIDSDFQTHTIFLGGRWRSDKKFSGVFRVGYKWAEFEQSEADEYEGYAADTNITYEFSEFTKLTHTAQSTIGSPTRSSRESGEYYVSNSIGFSITHRRWQRITTRLSLLYRNRNYREIQNSESIREDDYYRAGLSLDYAMRRWITFSLDYRYQENTSNIEGEDYSENLITFSIALRL